MFLLFGDWSLIFFRAPSDFSSDTTENGSAYESPRVENAAHLWHKIISSRVNYYSTIRCRKSSPVFSNYYLQVSSITTIPASAMTVIWGLDLREIQWSKFKSSYMFNRVYHLRRSKMIVYQLAMMLCVCSESVGTAALAGTSKPSSLLPHQCFD